MRFHLTDAGDAKTCTAQQGRCPYGGADEHYESAESARESYEAIQSMGALWASVKLSPSMSAMEEQIKRNDAIRRDLYLRYTDVPPVEKEFQDVQVSELEAYNQAYETYQEKLTEEELAAFYSYTGISYSPINEYLRNDGAFLEKNFNSEFDRDAWATKLIGDLDSALEKAPAFDRTVFRRLDQTSREDLVASEDWLVQLGYEEGKTVKMKSYSSTTINPGYIARTAQKDCHTSIVLAIEAKQGAPVGRTVLSMEEAVASQDREAEILLPRDLDLRVKRVERCGYTGQQADRIEVLTVFFEEL